jgi:hypothetical protein
VGPLGRWVGGCACRCSRPYMSPHNSCPTHTHTRHCLGRPLNLEVLVPKSRSTYSLDRANRFDVGGSGNCVACRIGVQFKEGVLELDEQI